MLQKIQTGTQIFAFGHGQLWKIHVVSFREMLDLLGSFVYTEDSTGYLNYRRGEVLYVTDSDTTYCGM